jgi:hypothetical protein
MLDTAEDRACLARIKALIADQTFLPRRFLLEQCFDDRFSLRPVVRDFPGQALVVLRESDQVIDNPVGNLRTRTGYGEDTAALIDQQDTAARANRPNRLVHFRIHAIIFAIKGNQQHRPGRSLAD